MNYHKASFDHNGHDGSFKQIFANHYVNDVAAFPSMVRNGGARLDSRW